MSLTTDALRELVECGLTAEQILRVAEANAGVKRAAPSSGAERQRRYRDRLTASGMTSAEWSRTSRRILARDGHACRYCEAPATCVDHVIPLHCEGSSDDSNLVAACNPCNSGKSGRTLEEWRGADWASAWKNASHNASHNASLDTPLPLPSSPQTPQQPTPTPGKTTRPRKAPLAKPETDVTEQVWQAASKPSRDRSGRPALGKAVLAAIRLGATGEAMVASVRDHCRAQGEFAKGVHHVVAGEHWRDHLGAGEATAAADGPVDPAVMARRMRRYADTGVWELGWGPMPPPKSEAA